MMGAILYTAMCGVVILAAFWLQSYRHRASRACIYWSYSLLAFAMAWEIIDTWQRGAPGFPASRWFLVLALDVILVGAVLKDRSTIAYRYLHR